MNNIQRIQFPTGVTDELLAGVRVTYDPRRAFLAGGGAMDRF